MRFPPAIAIAEQRLIDAGGEAFAVGGCVRDALLGRPCHDYDLTTNLPPARVIEAFAGYTVVPTGLRHGTVTVHIDGLPIDVTTYRIDGAYADGRHPAEVRFTGSLEDDLRRRDFTMNAVCHSAGRGFVDPFGGIGDIRAGRIRCVGDPHERFSEDALRILRAVRFAAQLGFAVEPETARAMYETAGGLARISAERIFSELTGALTAPYAGEAFAAFRALFAAVLPGCAERPLYPLNRLPADKAARFAAVLNVGEADTLRGLKSDRRTLEDVRFLHENRHFSGGRIELKKLLASHGERKARLLLGWLNADAALLDALLDGGECCSLRARAVNGRDVASLGVAPQKIGGILHALLDDVIEGRAANEKTALLKRAAEKYAKSY